MYIFSLIKIYYLGIYIIDDYLINHKDKIDLYIIINFNDS